MKPRIPRLIAAEAEMIERRERDRDHYRDLLKACIYGPVIGFIAGVAAATAVYWRWLS